MSLLEGEDDLENKISYENFKVWKKHVPYLYDAMVTHALEWPSLTVQWLPEKVKAPGRAHSERRLILGTHTSEDEQNYLMVAKVSLPSEDDKEVEGRIYNEDNEAGGYGNGKAKVEVTQRILHKGEVNRARYMPQNPSVIATKGPQADVYVFDYTRHPSQPKEGGAFKPDLTLHGHHEQGYGLSWSPYHEGRLLSGSEDGLICWWDVQTTAPRNSSLQPLETCKGHGGAVEDVAWSVHSEGFFGSVGDDKALMLWDVKDSAKPSQRVSNAHSAEVTCLAFSPFADTLLLTGSADNTIKMWDTRNLSSALHEYDSHTEGVTAIQWSTKCPEVFMSSGADKRILVWNNSRIGDNISKEAARDGPPELLFCHAGHLSRVSDVCWDPNDPWMCASVAEDNMLHVWSMDERIYNPSTNDNNMVVD